mmetsp:Transcript_29738/g.61168  ORF Transcript_29738/g.61168 Transcript_29738/m.61168 type:complete len:444 (+) Transcript_29738:915-2246(+)
MRIGMKESKIQQLRQIGDDSQIDQRPHIILVALTQLLSLDPLRDVHPPRGKLRIILRNDHIGQHTHLFLHLNPIVAFEVVIQLLIKAIGKFVEQRDGVESVRQGGEISKEQAEFPRQKKVQRHRLEDLRSLHFDRHGVSRGTQGGLVDLSQTRRRHRFRRDVREDVVDRRSQFPLDGAKGDGAIEGGDFVAELLQFHHAPGTEDVGSDAQRLTQLDEEGSEGGDGVSQFGRPADFEIGVGFEFSREIVRGEVEKGRSSRGGHLEDARGDEVGSLAEEFLEGDGVVFVGEAVGRVSVGGGGGSGASAAIGVGGSVDVDVVVELDQFHLKAGHGAIVVVHVLSAQGLDDEVGFFVLGGELGLHFSHLLGQLGDAAAAASAAAGGGGSRCGFGCGGSFVGGRGIEAGPGWDGGRGRGAEGRGGRSGRREEDGDGGGRYSHGCSLLL